MKNSLALVLCFALPVTARAITVEGKTFKPTHTVEGKTLKLIGAGLREKWVFDVYALGAYTESGLCDPQAIIGADEVKYIRLAMLRSVDAEKMATTIGEAFDACIPANASATLKKQRKTFEGYFKTVLSEGQVLEFTYVPGVGTTVVQNGKKLGPPLTGIAFQTVFWSIYFGTNTCCEDLKDQILAGCK